MSSDHRRQSILASKKRRPSIQLERRGTIHRRDSKVPLIDTLTDGMFGRGRRDSISAEADSAHPEASSLTEQNKDTLSSAGIELPTKQPSGSVTDQRDTAVTTEQGPPAVRRNTLFPDQHVTHVAQAQGKSDDSRSSQELQQSKEGGVDRSSRETQECKEVGDDRSSKEPQPVKEEDSQSAKVVDGTSRNMITQDKEAAIFPVSEDTGDVFDTAFVKNSKWSTLKNFFSSLQPHRGGGCSHVLNEVKHIAEGSGAIPSEDQIKEQVTVMAQHAIDSK